ncbi:hypothetical protein ARMSODRAFT_948133 [Armillaria solidipes]|uniref:F-box domain-containing protein n=1 Tax=Armillaria solidipes TaxID=1076256 RepID=A0A2H3BZS5_9AGAR|nr:hypothetical protein ARMSODRAFT_948133 [Armillaria solidipes]
MLSSPLCSVEDLVQAIATEHHSLNIPPEIYEEIIDYLWDNKDALLACSFCRPLYLRTRVHLFHSIELKHTPNGEPFSKSVLPCIKKITIHRGSDIPSVTPLLCSLPNLTALRLDTLKFPDPWSLHRFVCQLRRLTSLDLNHIRFRRDILVELGSLAGSFPKINKITIHGTSLHTSVVGFLIHRRALRAVYVDSLRELCIKYPAGECLSSICTFVRAASRSLKSLEIRIRETESSANVMSNWPAQLDVLPLTMPTLLIEMDCNHFGWHDEVMRWLLDSLTGADGPIMVETLTLVVVPPLYFNQDIMEGNDQWWARVWLRLDEILTGPDMKVFRRLKVTFIRPGDRIYWEGSHFIEWVRGKLPLVNNRNMLDMDTIVEDTS